MHNHHSTEPYERGERGPEAGGMYSRIKLSPRHVSMVPKAPIVVGGLPRILSI